MLGEGGDMGCGDPKTFVKLKSNMKTTTEE
jgi:hypothetical protein